MFTIDIGMAFNPKGRQQDHFGVYKAERLLTTDKWQEDFSELAPRTDKGYDTTAQWLWRENNPEADQCLNEGRLLTPV